MVFYTNGAEKKIKNLNTYFISYTKINSKWLICIGINIKWTNTITLLKHI